MALHEYTVSIYVKLDLFAGTQAKADNLAKEYTNHIAAHVPTGQRVMGSVVTLDDIVDQGALQ